MLKASKFIGGAPPILLLFLLSPFVIFGVYALNEALPIYWHHTLYDIETISLLSIVAASILWVMAKAIPSGFWRAISPCRLLPTKLKLSWCKTAEQET